MSQRLIVRTLFSISSRILLTSSIGFPLGSSNAQSTSFFGIWANMGLGTNLLNRAPHRYDKTCSSNHFSGQDLWSFRGQVNALLPHRFYDHWINLSGGEGSCTCPTQTLLAFESLAELAPSPVLHADEQNATVIVHLRHARQSKAS